MTTIIISLVFYLPYVAVFVLIQYALLQGPNKRRVYPLSQAGIAYRAALGVMLGLIVGGACGFLAMFGPSYATGDFIGLPWLTMLPALCVFLVVGFFTSFWLGRSLVLKARPGHLYR
jgi:uncharacterized membrane protein YqaE (UPF0057 family)